jgi:environmental stress-induced protein Ves
VSAARLIRVDDTPPQHWRNGGGWTRELLAWPSSSDWQVRVSVADIEADGPFSPFPGVQRFFAVLQGAGVELTVDGTVLRVQRDGPAVKFSGDAQTSCILVDGPTRDLNLMVRNEYGALDRVVSGQPWQPQAPSCGLFALTAGRCLSDDVSMDVPSFSLLWFATAPAALTFDSAGWWLAA